MTNIDSVPEEEPAVARSQWRAVSDGARSVTGNLRVSLAAARGGPVVFAFANGVTVTAQPINVVPAENRSGVGGQSFAAVLGGDPRVNAHVYRVVTDNVTRSAAQGGLCGAERTRHLAVSEFVDSNGTAWSSSRRFGASVRPARLDKIRCCAPLTPTPRPERDGRR